MKKIVFSVALLCAVGAFALAQDGQNLSNSTKPLQPADPPLDGYVTRTDIENRKVIPYASLRETDVAYQRRIWREIDVREKINRVFASPKARLIDILVKAVLDGELTAYDPTPTEDDPGGDDFSKMAILRPDELMMRLGGDSVLVEQFDENNEVIGSSYQAKVFDGESVLKFRIKEDWIFDKQRSIFEPRILGIAPLITPEIPGMSEDADFSGLGGGTGDDPFASQDGGSESANLPSLGNAGIRRPDPIPAFWIYFPEARHILVNKDVMNRHNTATGLSYDDVFIKRMFASYIVKVDNPNDLRIKDYIPDEMERLYESERIKKALMDWEQDLWSY